ncbi:MAG TPA: response regulator [Ktedonobacteraceae bacterium]|nr:response regulator [Ktedonobacteraceae bacterium]
MMAAQKNIMVVDDDLDILEAISLMLEDAGYMVMTTNKGDFIEHLDTNKLPDMIILDMLLSGSDGRDITRQLKKHARTKHIPIIMLSAHPKAKQEAQTSGADDFLPKPFEMDELLEKVAHFITS